MTEEVTQIALVQAQIKIAGCATLESHNWDLSLPGIVSSQLALLAQLDTKSVCQYMTAAFLAFYVPNVEF